MAALGPKVRGSRFNGENPTLATSQPGTATMAVFSLFASGNAGIAVTTMIGAR